MVDKKENRAATRIIGRDIRQLLDGACAERSRVTLRFEPEGPTFVSNLVHLYDSQLLLQGLGSPSMRSRLEPNAGVKAAFTFRRPGIFEFHSTFAGFKDHVSEQFLVEAPELIEHVQRRSAYRVEPLHTLPATVVSIGGKSTRGRVRVENVSLSGVCLSFPQQAPIRVGSLIVAVLLRLYERPEITLDGVVRSITRGGDGRFRLGLEWAALDGEQERTLEHYIAACQVIEAKIRR